MSLLKRRRVYVAAGLLLVLLVAVIATERLMREAPTDTPAVAPDSPPQSPDDALIASIQKAVSTGGTREQILATTGVEPDVDTTTETGRMRVHFNRRHVDFLPEELRLSYKSRIYWLLPKRSEVVGIIWDLDDQPHFFRGEVTRGLRSLK